MRNIIVITLLCSTLSHAYALKRGDGQEIDRILHWVEDHSEDHVSECLDSLLKAERLSHRVESFKSRVKVLLSLSRFTLVRLNNLERCHLYLEVFLVCFVVDPSACEVCRFLRFMFWSFITQTLIYRFCI